MKRLVIESDYHCGGWYGLTPPDWWLSEKTSDPTVKKIAKAQRELWRWRETLLRALAPIDFLVVNGDLIDGKGERSGGTEQRVLDRIEQCEMAAVSIDEVGASECAITYGTPYHTGSSEDYEKIVVGQCKTPAAKITGHYFMDFCGVKFDVKHFVGGSQIPHGRFTAIARSKLWNDIWAERDQQPDADVLVRSHVHYFGYCGGSNWLAMTTPAMCGFGSKFGIRRCEGLVDIGLVVFDCDKGEYSWQPHLAELPQQKVHVVTR